MPLSDDEKRHIEAVEEYRQEVRRRLEEAHAPGPRGAGRAGRTLRPDAHAQNVRCLWVIPAIPIKFFKMLAAAASACCAVLASCSAPEAVRIPVRSCGSLSNQILQEVNHYRVSKGVEPLARNPGLDRLAQEHCEYLRSRRRGSSLSRANINHQGFKSRASYARLYYHMSRLSENVAGVHGGTTVAPGRMVKLWSESPSHDHAMRGNWNATGIGAVVYSDGTVIATQLFGFSRIQQTTYKGGFLP